MVGDPGVQVGGPVAAVAAGRAGWRRGRGVRRRAGVGTRPRRRCRGRGTRAPGPKTRQLAGSEARRPRSTSSGLGLDPEVVAEVLGQGVERVGDHLGLRQVQVAGGEGVGGLGPALVERGRQRRVAAYGAVGVCASGRPARSRWTGHRWPRRRRRPWRAPAARRASTRARVRARPTRAISLLLHRHVDRVHPGDLVERGVDGRDRRAAPGGGMGQVKQ